MFQTPALWPHLTVAQNIRFGLYGWQPAAARARLGEIMAQTRVNHLANRYPAQLSGGEARRVALARSLAPQPALLLLDEPLANLDPELHQEMLDLIRTTVVRDKLGLIYVTHNPEEAAQVAGRRVYMRRGRLRGRPPRSLMSDNFHPLEATMMRAGPRQDPADFPGDLPGGDFRLPTGLVIC